MSISVFSADGNICYTKEICSNNIDDDCDSVIDESGCISVNSRITHSSDLEEQTYEKWAAGYLVDYVDFGSLHDSSSETYIDNSEREHDVEWCGSRSGYTYFHGGCAISWNFTVSDAGYYVWSQYSWNTAQRNSNLSYYNGSEIVPTGNSSQSIEMHLIYLSEPGSYRFYSYGNYGNRIFHSQLFKLREDPVINNNESGMRLISNYDSIDELRNDITTSWEKVVYDDAVNDANSRINDDPSDYDECVQGSAMDNRGLKGRVMDIAAGYILTGDSIYSEPGIQILRHVSNMSHWVCKATWSYLSHGEIANALSVAFDSFKDEMDLETRNEIIRNSDRLINDLFIHSINSEHSGDSSHFWSIQPGNWNAVINGGGLGTAAIAFEYDNKYAGDWLEQAVQTQELYFDKNFDDDGAYIESLMYISYALNNAAMFYQSLEKYHDINFMTYRDNTFLKAAYMHMYFIEPNYQDASPFDDGSRWYLDAATSSKKPVAVGSYWFLAANYFDDPVLRRFTKFVYDFNSDERLVDIFHDYLGYPSTIAWLFKKGDEITHEQWDDVKQSIIYPDYGRYMTRSGYEDKDAYYLAMQSGIYGSHGQADQGSFIIHALGEVLIDDNGYGTKNSSYHNVIMVDGHGQQLFNDKLYDGSFDANLNTDKLDYILANSTAGYKNNIVDIDINYNLRNMIFVRPTDTQDGYYFLADNINSNISHEYKFNLHHRAGASEWVDLGDNNFKVNSVIFTEENVDLDIFFSSPSSFNSYFYEGSSNFSIVPTSKTTEEHFVTLLYPNDETHVVPENVMKINNDDFSGFSFNNDTLLYNKNNELNSYQNDDIGMIETDAEIYIQRINNNTNVPFDFIAIYDGSSISIGGQKYFESDKRVNVVMDFVKNDNIINETNLILGNEVELQDISQDVEITIYEVYSNVTYNYYENGLYKGNINSSIYGTIMLNTNTIKKTISLIVSDGTKIPIHDSDVDASGNISLDELRTYIDNWKNLKIISLKKLIGAISIWKGQVE